MASQTPTPPAGPTPAEIAAHLAAAITLIDGFLTRVGLDPATITDPQGWRHFSVGSARGRAGAVVINGVPFLRIEAPVMSLPSDRELILPLMRELLELNHSLPSSGALSIQNETVHALLMWPAAGLREADVAHCMQSVIGLADWADDRLIATYGGTTTPRIPPDEPLPRVVPPMQRPPGSPPEEPGQGLYARLGMPGFRPPDSES
ncbi:MAG TPA: hypothetical protein PKA05_22930 [Roseiflexaceae bacterium]|nr:hypothetical protein [Roseiflexaceae bacterium]HMP43247.1 hypothetical protein [Roseiflexaceae bacterium]